MPHDAYSSMRSIVPPKKRIATARSITPYVT